MGPLRLRQMRRTDASSLALSPAEGAECVAVGLSPKIALLMGYLEGPAWAVERTVSGSLVGCFGYTRTGVIWSLWGSLGRAERAQLAGETIPWVSAMVTAYGGRLSNHVSVDNKVARLWLHKTGCFEWADEPHLVAGKPFLRFTTKPLRELDRMAR